ncbi:MAG: hydroxymethylbilane synthase [Kiritimatiellia bacterium]
MTIQVGTRGSLLARLQTDFALQHLSKLLPGCTFSVQTFDTPGDRDLTTPLPQTPGDFFTRDLDQAILDRRLDLAIHSAKDLPENPPEGVDWIWLPWYEPPEDCLVLQSGLDLPTFETLSCPRIGVSSARREAWCQATYPHARCLPVRGAIPNRLAQLDDGRYDAILTACAALNRLGLAHRIARVIPLSELAPPPGQGILAITFRRADPLLTLLRNTFVKAVRFVGAGTGNASLCTLSGAQDLADADICLYDELLDPALLDYLPKQAIRVPVGKRCAAHSVPQETICRLIADAARQGKRVVRLKGGDAGIFGRLSEEIAWLDRYGLPYCVRPGVSTLSVATTGTGRLLTCRGRAHGFTVETPRRSADAPRQVSHPRVLFMAAKVAREEARKLLAQGYAPGTFCAVVYGAGGLYERTVETTLEALSKEPSLLPETHLPGLLLVDVPPSSYHPHGVLGGLRVLLTCSSALQPRAIRLVEDWGGIPLRFPLFRLAPVANQSPDLSGFDWVVLSSPTAIRIFLERVENLRTLPRVMVCGPGSEAELRRWRLKADLLPEGDFGASGLLRAAERISWAGKRVLRMHSSKADLTLSEGLRLLGAEVEDCLLYRNEPLPNAPLPDCECLFFASRSAVEIYRARYGEGAFKGRRVVALGGPTSKALPPGINWIEGDGTLEGTIRALADRLRLEQLERLLRK